MLVLSRKENESLRIGDEIKLTVLEVDGSSVKVGIEAPEEVTVLREELWKAIREQTKIAQRLALEEQEPEAFHQLRDLLVEVEESRVSEES